MLTSYFLFNDTATTEIYTLALHDALPISGFQRATLAWLFLPRWFLFNPLGLFFPAACACWFAPGSVLELFSLHVWWRSEAHTSELSHANISYAVFCLKKKTPI